MPAVGKVSLPGRQSRRVSGVFTCRACGRGNLELILDLGMQPWGNDFRPMELDQACPRYPLEFFYCHDCTMCQIGHTVPKETMFREHGYLSGTTRSLARHFDSVASRIAERVAFGPSDYVLDVGGNDGTFLRFVRERELDVFNVDAGINQHRASLANGIPCINRFFNLETADDIRRERGPAKVIHGSGIFFHLEELHSAFEGVRHLLADDGVVVAEFIYLPSMVETTAFDQIYHEHLTYYTLGSFERLLQEHGLRINDAELASIHGGSCIAYIGHGESASPALVDLRERERRGGYDTATPYRQFARDASALRDRIGEGVRGLRADGRRIQALGAPVKGTTILHYCGLNERDIECAVEINRLKCGTFYPGTRIPVVYQDEVEPPDVYLLLAWNFRDEIMPKLERFRTGGGRVLVPIPEAELI